ncbi:MAG: hypothetical protein WC670_05380 [Pseudolabrys sp.]|jgi:hypothetical protein
MRKTLTLLFATTALTAAIGFPAWSAMQPSADGSLGAIATLFEEGAQAMPLVLASGKDGDDDHRYRKSPRRGHDDVDDDDDDDDDNGRSSRGGAGNPAPAGMVAPPQNGLFGNGAPPKAQVN